MNAEHGAQDQSGDASHEEVVEYLDGADRGADEMPEIEEGSVLDTLRALQLQEEANQSTGHTPRGPDPTATEESGNRNGSLRVRKTRSDRNDVNEEVTGERRSSEASDGDTPGVAAEDSQHDGAANDNSDVSSIQDDTPSLLVRHSIKLHSR